MSEPPITRRAAHGSRPQTGTPTRVVIHDEEHGLGPNSAEDIAGYFAGQGSGGSAHYVVDSNSEQHCVPDSVQAWHAPPNDRSIGIEQDGYAHFTAADWDTLSARATIARCAARTAELCARFGIPVTWIYPADLARGAHGITDHDNVSHTWHQSDHNDVGGGYPRPRFMALVAAGYVHLRNEAAIREFQHARGLVVDGDPGLRTVLSLGDWLFLHYLDPATPLSGKVPAKPKPTPSPTPQPQQKVPAKPTGPDRFKMCPTIAAGATDATSAGAVSVLQHALVAVGYHIAVDGDFGGITEGAVKAYQAAHGLIADGVVGALTWASLGASLTKGGK